MNFHEYQSKQLLAEYGIPVPAGKVAATPDEAVEVANSLGNGPWMVKAQIHAGGRGKAGGVKFCKTTDDVKAAAAKMLGTKMSTYQTAGVELPINLVLVTTAGEIVKELYLSILVDRGTKTITYIASSEGGVEIEQVAAETPELIHALNVDFVEGVQGYHGRDFGFKLGLNAKQAGQFASIMVNLYKLFNEKDLALVEINPLAILDDGNLYALDGKFDSDDNAAFRQKQLVAMRDKTQEDETEVTASELDINYVTMADRVSDSARRDTTVASSRNTSARSLSASRRTKRGCTSGRSAPSCSGASSSRQPLRQRCSRRASSGVSATSDRSVDGVRWSPSPSKLSAASLANEMWLWVSTTSTPVRMRRMISSLISYRLATWAPRSSASIWLRRARAAICSQMKATAT